MTSLLPIVKAADNLPPHPHSPFPTHSPDGAERYVPFHLTFSDFQRNLTPVGLLRPSVVAELQSVGSGSSCGPDEDSEQSPFQFYSTATPLGPASSERTGDDLKRKRTEASEPPTTENEEDQELELQLGCVFFADWVIEGGSERMSQVMKETVERWRAEGKFPGPLAGWRNEQYQLYHPPTSSAFPSSSSSTSSSGPFWNKAFTLERAACAIFGLATFGVHMTAYEGEGKEMKIWVPRRAKGKATWPGKLDNTVAGGIPAGMQPLECLVKECDEEASLPEALVRDRIKSVGVVTYFYITNDGYLQPEIEYIYDLPLPPRDTASYVLPKPHDDEVESFSLMRIPDTIAAMRAGEFKPNCGAILVDFLVRHGYVNPENEPNYLEIRWALGRRLGIAVPA